MTPPLHRGKHSITTVSGPIYAPDCPVCAKNPPVRTAKPAADPEQWLILIGMALIVCAFLSAVGLNNPPGDFMLDFMHGQACAPGNIDPASCTEEVR